MSLALDTLAIARRLQAAGFPESQAEAVTTVIRDSRDADLSVLATKADLEALRLSTKADLDALRLSTKTDLDALRLSTKADIEAAKTDIIKWVFGAIGFQTVVIVGAAITIARLFVK